MTRALIFLTSLGLGMAVLLHYAGGFEGNAPEKTSADLPRAPKKLARGTGITPPEGDIEIESASNITQMAPPTRVIWKDRLSDETITIENFQPWRCTASAVEPLPLAGTAQQGARLKDVVFEVYRDPTSRAEAMALRDMQGDARYAALLLQRFVADNALVSGQLGEAMASKRSGNATERGLGDTKLTLAGNVVIEDHGQGFVIRGAEGTELAVWPDQERATGVGPFELTHEAMVLTGSGLSMMRDKARGYGRVEINKDPRLRILAAGRGKDGKPLFDFGDGDFRPTTVSCEGRAVLVRESSRRETLMTVTFADRVSVAQEGGRMLTARRATLTAVRASGPRLDTGGWKLRSFHAHDNVAIHYPGRTSKGEAFLASVTAGRLLHDVPVDGSRATTVFEDNVEILMRGELALLGPEGRLRATCHERAWIGPLPEGAPDGGIDRAFLQQISLRGRASVVRLSVQDDARVEDEIQGDVIDLVVWQPQGAAPGPVSEARMVAVHFAALGHVQIEGPRVRGSTHRIVGDALHTAAPRIVAHGKGTWFTFRQLARNQGLLGPDGPAGTPTDDAPGTKGANAEDDDSEEKGHWALQRLVARGAVDIDTSLGGPTVGIPTHLVGDILTYDGISQQARISALGSQLVRMAWSATRTNTNQIETRELTLDRAAGRISATGGVEGELYLARTRGGRSFGLPGARGIKPSMEGAELTVRTDERIDIAMARTLDGAAPAPDAEQLIRIAGPVTTELRSNRQIVDRMRSNELEVALRFERPAAKPKSTSVPLTRADRGPRSTTAPAAVPSAAGPVDRFDVTAGSVHIDLQGGEARRLEADGGVDLRSRGGHVTGQRLTYDGVRRRVEVHAGSTPARAMLGRGGQRSEVQAGRMVVDVHEGRAVRLEAHAPTGRTSDVHLYRDTVGKPGQREWFMLTYQGSLVMTDARLTTERVRVIRRTRLPGAKDFADPIVLRTPRLHAVGRNMLATSNAQRHIGTIEALEHGTGPGSEVNFRWGQGSEQTEVWGHRLTIDMTTQRARFYGRRDRRLKIRSGGRLMMDYASVEFDLANNLPTFIPGGRIHWKPGKNR